MSPCAVGYCNVGRVLEVGAGVDGMAAGDVVASNGRHAGVVVVGNNLCAKVPEGVSDDAAVFAVPGAIALQGVRLAGPTLGEVFVVTGLGLIGLIAVQLLRATAARCWASTPIRPRLTLGRAFGAETCDLSRARTPRASPAPCPRGAGSMACC